MPEWTVRRHAELNLRSGAECPYDHAGDDPPSAALDWAEAAARGVLSDLCGRGGIKHELYGIDQGVRVELVATMAEIIRVAHEQSTKT